MVLVLLNSAFVHVVQDSGLVLISRPPCPIIRKFAMFSPYEPCCKQVIKLQVLCYVTFSLRFLGFIRSWRGVKHIDLHGALDLGLSEEILYSEHVKREKKEGGMKANVSVF